jgi:hypothetical protein
VLVRECRTEVVATLDHRHFRMSRPLTPHAEIALLPGGHQQLIAPTGTAASVRRQRPESPADQARFAADRHLTLNRKAS